MINVTIYREIARWWGERGARVICLLPKKKKAAQAAF
jgi:hypothetical protein